MISKELLSLSLDIPLYAITDVVLNNNNEVLYSTYTLPTIKYKAVNLDTLGRLCKDWLKCKGYVVTITHHLDTVAVYLHAGVRRYSSESMSVYTELEAIIKATEWVANEKNML